MKTIRLFGIALMIVLMSVSISACGGSDDDDIDSGSSSASIEGTWFLKSEIWYEWNGMANKPVENSGSMKNYGDYAKKMTWILTKNGDNIDCKEITDNNTHTSFFYHDSGNEYYTKSKKNGSKKDRVIFKSVSEKQIVVEYYEHYFTDRDDDEKEYGVLTFMR